MVQDIAMGELMLINVAYEVGLSVQRETVSWPHIIGGQESYPKSDLPSSVPTAPGGLEAPAQFHSKVAIGERLTL